MMRKLTTGKRQRRLADSTTPAPVPKISVTSVVEQDGEKASLVVSLQAEAEASIRKMQAVWPRARIAK
jgi:hypothetical protein